MNTEQFAVIKSQKEKTMGLDQHRWISRFKKREDNEDDTRIAMSVAAESVLEAHYFEKEEADKEKSIIILKHLNDNDITECTVRLAAKKLGLKTPSTEIACLILDKFTPKDFKKIGVESLICMHKPLFSRHAAVTYTHTCELLEIVDCDNEGLLLLTYDSMYDYNLQLDPSFTCECDQLLCYEDSGFVFVE